MFKRRKKMTRAFLFEQGVATWTIRWVQGKTHGQELSFLNKGLQPLILISNNEKRYGLI